MKVAHDLPTAQRESQDHEAKGGRKERNSPTGQTHRTAPRSGAVRPPRSNDRNPRGIRTKPGRKMPSSKGEEFTRSTRAEPERTEEDLGGERSPWKDRAFRNRQRSRNVTDSSVEQGPEADRTAPHTPPRGDTERKAREPLRKERTSSREPAGRNLHDPTPSGGGTNGTRGHLLRQETGERPTHGPLEIARPPEPLRPSRTRTRRLLRQTTGRSGTPPGTPSWRERRRRRPLEGHTWSGGTEEEPPRRGDPAKVTSR